ncbi:MAG: signal peptidase I [Patescibacteria group bacterium]
MFRRLGSFFLDILEVVVFAIGIFFFVYLLIMRPHKIKGQSMHPNFPDGEYLLTQKVSYYFHGPERGDVIVFKPPISQDDEFIKRIIALPGDSVKVIGGKVYINGIKLAETYLADTLFTSSSNFLEEGEEYVVPTGNWIVMGDNRPHSSDSRSWGPITKKEISGKAWLVYWPPKQSGFVEKINY